MASDTVVRARIDTETKDRATKALSAMGDGLGFHPHGAGPGCP